MRLPWAELSRDEYEQICYEIARKLGFEQRTLVETGPHNKIGHDIIGNRVSDILPGVSYHERWLITPVSYQSIPIVIEDIEFLKSWADEPRHEIDYVLIITPSSLSTAAEEWIYKFNKFPVSKYKIKLIGVQELEQLVCTDKKILKEYFYGFEPEELSGKAYGELKDIITKKLLNFKSDIGVIDFSIAFLSTISYEDQVKIIRNIAMVWSSGKFSRLKRWNAGWVIIRLAKLKPEIVPVKIVEKVALEEDNDAIKALASHVYAWLTETDSNLVNPEILGKLASTDNDYFIHVPATKALSRLLHSDPNGFEVIFKMIKNKDIKRRKLAGKILLSLSDESPMLIPSSAVKMLQGDRSEKIKKIGDKLSEKLESFWEAPQRSDFVRAKEEFEVHRYRRAQAIFSKIANNGKFSLSHEARWWSGYSYYLLNDYAFSLREFEKLKKCSYWKWKCTAYWWSSICLEKISKYDESYKALRELAQLLVKKEAGIKIAPEGELNGEEFQKLIFKRLKEVKSKI